MKNLTSGQRFAVEQRELDTYIEFQTLDCRKLLGREPTKEEIEYLSSGFRGGFRACVRVVENTDTLAKGD